jgi:hypothetical protein
MLRPAAILLLLALASGAAAAQPALTFEAPRHDLGAMTEGEVATHVFAFTNTGNAPLAIAEVETSCGCTTPQWTSDPVAPGASGTVTVAFDSQGRPGPFERTVRVVAPEAGAVTLRILGTVESAFVASGVAVGSVTFSEVEAEAAAGESHAFYLQHTGARPVRFASVEAPEGVRVSFPDRRFFSGDVRAVIVTPEAIAPGESVEVRIETDDAAQPVKVLRLRVR